MRLDPAGRPARLRRRRVPRERRRLVQLLRLPRPAVRHAVHVLALRQGREGPDLREPRHGRSLEGGVRADVPWLRAGLRDAPDRAPGDRRGRQHRHAGSFKATVLPGASPACTTTITGKRKTGLTVESGVTCIDGRDDRRPGHGSSPAPRSSSPTAPQLNRGLHGRRRRGRARLRRDGEPGHADLRARPAT